jgi:hypothetical protein
MTIQEALDILNSISNKQQQIYISCDSEGNRFLPLGNIQEDILNEEYELDPDLNQSDVVCVMWPD